MPGSPLLIADSFYLRWNTAAERHEVRGLDRHLRRFQSGVRATATRLGLDAWADHALEPFLRSVPELLTAEYAVSPEASAGCAGSGFPRLECWFRHEPRESPLLTLRPRPLPDITESLHLATHPRPPLDFPQVKGPNIDRYRALQEACGGEVLLLDDAGCIIEGTTTSVLWWEGQTLYHTPRTGRVESVTEALIIEAAWQRGYPVRCRTATSQKLHDCEVWAVNALHGIRRVATIDGHVTARHNDARLREFRAALEASWQPVLGHHTKQP